MIVSVNGASDTNLRKAIQALKIRLVNMQERNKREAAEMVRLQERNSQELYEVSLCVRVSERAQAVVTTCVFYPLRLVYISTSQRMQCQNYFFNTCDYFTHNWRYEMKLRKWACESFIVVKADRGGGLCE